MKHWGSALFPLGILLVLTALSFWLRHAVELPEARRDGKNRHDPDYTVHDAQLRKYDENGSLQYTLVSNNIRHYPDDDTTDIAQPTLTWLRPDRPVVTMTAERGHVSRQGEQVDLLGDVKIRRAAEGTQEELVATTPTLTILTRKEQAFTPAAVLVTQGASWLRGTGMQLDNKNRTLVLESQATGQFRSPQARKKGTRQ